jgi:hypothetical protein
VIRGWLLLLALLLTVWEPLNLGLVASAVLPRITDRPAALLVLGARLLATAVGLAAGVALFRRRPHAIRLTTIALVLSSATALLMLARWFPANRPPGTRVPLILLTLVYNAAWLWYLRRSKQVRQTFESPG